MRSASVAAMNRLGVWAISARGQGLVEYAMILTLVSVVAVVILLTQGQQLQNMFSNVSCTIARKC